MNLWRKKLRTLFTVGLVLISVSGLAHAVNLTRSDPTLCQSSCGASLPTTGIVFDIIFEQDDEPEPFAAIPYYALFIPLLGSLLLTGLRFRLVPIRPPNRLAQSALLRI